MIPLSSNYKINHSLLNSNIKDISQANFEVSNLKSIDKSLKFENSVTDKSKAVKEILGYGVDKDGFFTSDFNEAVGLSKDFKIHSQSVRDLADKLSKNITFSSVDIVQTLSNVYQIFSQLTSTSSFDQAGLENLPLGFSVDKKSLKITQIYDEQKSLSHAIYGNETPYLSKNIAFASFKADGIDETLASKDFNLNLIDKEHYINSQGKLDKSGVFMAFSNSITTQALSGFIIEGRANITGKMMGYDKTMSRQEVVDLNDFVSANSFFVDKNVQNESQMIASLTSLLALFRADLDVKDFKAEILKRKDLEAENASVLQKDSLNVDNINLKTTTQDHLSTNSNQNEKLPKDKLFTPITAKSLGKTYKDTESNFFLQKLLKEKFKESDLLEILFTDEINLKNQSLNNDDLISKISSLNKSKLKNAHQAKSINLKA